MTFDLETRQEDRVIVESRRGEIVLKAVSALMPSPAAITLTKKEAGRLWAALGKAIRDQA